VDPLALLGPAFPVSSRFSAHVYTLVVGLFLFFFLFFVIETVLGVEREKESRVRVAGDRSSVVSLSEMCPPIESN
jgi:hypothetical protein